MDEFAQVKNQENPPFAQLGNRIKTVRQYLEQGQEALALVLGITVGTLSRYETGWRQMPAGQLTRLARMARGIRAEWLLTGDGEMFTLLAKYDALPPAQRARLWALLDAGAADPPEPPAEALNETSERTRGKR